VEARGWLAGHCLMVLLVLLLSRHSGQARLAAVPGGRAAG